MAIASPRSWPSSSRLASSRLSPPPISAAASLGRVARSNLYYLGATVCQTIRKVFFEPMNSKRRLNRCYRRLPQSNIGLADSPKSGAAAGPKLLVDPPRATLVRGGGTFGRIGGPPNRYLYLTAVITTGYGHKGMPTFGKSHIRQIEVPIPRSAAAPKNVETADRCCSGRLPEQHQSAAAPLFGESADLGIGTSIRRLRSRKYCDYGTIIR